LKPYQYTKLEMGVQCRITTYASTEADARRACTSAFKRIDELEQIMSDYRANSELNRLCDKAGDGPQQVSPDLLKILGLSQALSKHSGGAFDVTASPLIRVWRQARKTKQMPSVVELKQAKALTNWQFVRLDARRRTVWLTKPGMRLDLGGIGKGYACDAALRVLRQQGMKSALVEMGGDIAAGDPPPGKKGWRIAIAESPGVLSGYRLLRNCGISTSGDTVQFVEIGGRRYSHVVDPRTGWALTNHIAVTVIAGDATTSDGLSTAISVLGEQERRELRTHYRSATAYVRKVSADD